MDIMDIFGDVIEFAQDKIDTVTEFWDSLSEERKKLLIGCVVGAVAVIAVASIFYGLGKCRGRKLAFDEEDF